MTKEATPKKAMFANRPYSQEERLKKDEEEQRLMTIEFEKLEEERILNETKKKKNIEWKDPK